MQDLKISTSFSKFEQSDKNSFKDSERRERKIKS
jgi:hypothetical protein